FLDFFLSSRRRHTRFSRDWSSDVCSSDLEHGGRLLEEVGNLTLTKRQTIKDEIGGLAPSGVTPLAETLADIGRYFSQGATNLVLHPNTNPQTVSRESVFDNGYTRHTSWRDV